MGEVGSQVFLLLYGVTMAVKATSPLCREFRTIILWNNLGRLGPFARRLVYLLDQDCKIAGNLAPPLAILVQDELVGKQVGQDCKK